MAAIKILGVPMDLGASRRGVDMGPSALRISRLGPQLRALGHDVLDAGNLEVRIPEAQHYGERRRKFLTEISDACGRLRDEVRQSIDERRIPLIMGGDHSIAAGTVAGLAQAYHARGEELGLIWLDAHGDLNTPETSPSGNIHGMPLAAILGHGAPGLTDLAGFSPMIAPERCAIVGARDLDPGERALIRELGLRVFTMREVDERSLRAVMEEAISLASSGTAGFHVSFDVDWIDPREAPGVGTPVYGGATYREAHLAMEMIADTQRLIGLEIVEVNPVLDVANKTGDLATGIALSAFGKKIL